MSTLFRMPGGEIALFAKGSPEVILSRCAYIYSAQGLVQLTNADRQELMQANREMANRALKVIALACRVLDPCLPVLSSLDQGQALVESAEELEQDLIWLGLAGMWDPPRPEVPAALELCRQAGVKVLVLTGDQSSSAAALARRLGLLGPSQQPYTGQQLAALSDQELVGEVERIAANPVVARVTPEDKLRLVKALRQKGEVVAMIGDGINDAPAIKEADIGIAMGSVGTEVARRAADLVLLNDNFATVVKAIEEGRGIYSNIRRAIRYLLATNASEVMLVLTCAVFGKPLPLLPVQMLWLNLLGDGLPALALILDPPEPGLMQRPPRAPGEDLFAGQMGHKIIIRGASIGLASGIIYLLGLTSGNLARARTLALTSLTVSQLLHTLDCRDEEHEEHKVNSSGEQVGGGSPGLAVPATLAVSGLSVLAALYWPWLGRLLRTVPLSGRDWVAVLAQAVLSSQIDFGLRRLCLPAPALANCYH